MNDLPCIVLDKFPTENELGDIKSYVDDYYWTKILSYPLIMIPNNRIIFWGFDIKISKNQYELLKSIIELHTNDSNKLGFIEEDIIKNIAYHRCNNSVPKKRAIHRFIITAKSSIKAKIISKVVDSCVCIMERYQFNPFVKGKLAEKKSAFSKEKDYRNDKKFEKQLLNVNINLTKLFSGVFDFTSPYNKHYAYFVLEKAINSLIYTPTNSPKKENSVYTTFFNLNLPPFEIRPPSEFHSFTSGKFKYPYNSFKHNSANFINYPQFVNHM